MTEEHSNNVSNGNMATEGDTEVDTNNVVLEMNGNATVQTNGGVENEGDILDVADTNPEADENDDLNLNENRVVDMEEDDSLDEIADNIQAE